MILGVNNFCFAEDGITAYFPITATNSGLNQGDTVTFNLYLKLTKDGAIAGETCNIDSLDFTVKGSNNVKFKECKFENLTATQSASCDKDGGDTTLGTCSWADTNGYDFNVCASDSVSNGTLLAIFTYELTDNSSEGDTVNLAVLINEDSTVDISSTTSVAVCEQTGAQLAYSLQNAPACIHNNKTHEAAKPATCTEDGNIEYWYCKDCKKYFSDEKCQTEILADNVKKSALGHSIEQVQAKEATCTEEGNKEYYRCTKCGALFSDKEGTQSTTLAEVTVPAKGHTWDEGVVTQEATYLADGVRTYTCPNCRETKTEVIPKFTHDDPTAGVQYWGTREVHNGHEMYVDAEGKTSALVTGNEKIWLREESYDPATGQNLAAWYMLDNTSGEFEAGSRFRVQWLNNKDNPIEFLKHFNNIDQTIKDRIDSNRVWIFLVGVTKPDGTTEYKTLSQEIPLYIQMGTDWDYSDIKAMYISDSEDEEVYASYLNMEYPEGKGEFAKLGLKHFSPYAIYDNLTDEEKAEFDKLTDEEKAQLNTAFENLSDEEVAQLKEKIDSSSNQVKTGDETGYIVLMSSSMALIAGLYLELCMKKKRN